MPVSLTKPPIGTPKGTWPNQYNQNFTDIETTLNAAEATANSATTAAATAQSTADTAQTTANGRAPASHTHSVNDLTATGIKNASTFLAGDNSFKPLTSATENVAGVAEIATEAEVLQGLDNVRYVTPATLLARFNQLIQGAPDAMNTLMELSAALADDPNFASSIAEAIANRQPINVGLTQIANIAPNENDFVQRKAGTWVNSSIDDVKTDLGVGQVAVGAISNPNMFAGQVVSIEALMTTGTRNADDVLFGDGSWRSVSGGMVAVRWNADGPGTGWGTVPNDPNISRIFISVNDVNATQYPGFGPWDLWFTHKDAPVTVA